MNPGSEYENEDGNYRSHAPRSKTHLLLELATEKRRKMLAKLQKVPKSVQDLESAIESVDAYTPFAIRMIELERKCSSRNSVLMNSLF